MCIWAFVNQFSHSENIIFKMPAIYQQLTLCSQEPLDSGEEMTWRVMLWVVQDILSMWVCDGPWLMALGDLSMSTQIGLGPALLAFPGTQTHTKLHLTSISNPFHR